MREGQYHMTGIPDSLMNVKLCLARRTVSRALMTILYCKSYNASDMLFKGDTPSRFPTVGRASIYYFERVLKFSVIRAFVSN